MNPAFQVMIMTAVLGLFARLKGRHTRSRLIKLDKISGDDTYFMATTVGSHFSRKDDHRVVVRIDSKELIVSNIGMLNKGAYPPDHDIRMFQLADIKSVSFYRHFVTITHRDDTRYLLKRITTFKHMPSIWQTLLPLQVAGSSLEFRQLLIHHGVAVDDQPLPRWTAVLEYAYDMLGLVLGTGFLLYASYALNT